MQDEVLFRSLDRSHAAKLGLIQGPLIRPSLVRDAEAGDESARSIDPMLAVDEYRPIEFVGQQGQRPPDAFDRWSAHRRHGDVDILDAQRFEKLRLPGTLAPFPQVDDGFNAKRGQILKPFVRRLSGAIEMFIHPVEPMEAFDLRLLERCGVLRDKAVRQRDSTRQSTKRGRKPHESLGGQNCQPTRRY